MYSVGIQMASLYVGDLHPDVTDSLLMEKFSSVGQVHSVRLCRSMRPGTTNKYAFVNYQHETDAKHALDLLNYDILLGQPMRIMWSNRNPSLRNSNTGNIFIKGLEKSIDSRALYDTFSNFGKVLSCKVVCDENGSRGYGYVHFENAEDADTAIKMLNGTLFNDLKVFLTHFKSYQERQTANSGQVYMSQAHKEDWQQTNIHNTFEQVQTTTVGKKPNTTVADTVTAVVTVTPAPFSAFPATIYNVSSSINPVAYPLNPLPVLYVGDLHPDVTESVLLEKFNSVGHVKSVRLCRSRKPGTSNSYAFISFQHETDAARALDQLNYDIVLGQPMRIMWSNRNSSLRNSNTGNIFIKGLEKSIDSLALYDIFLEFGNILSCKVVCDEHGSRGYGYVHFENAEDAETAIRKLNGTLFKDHKLSITHFKSHQERQTENILTANGDSRQVHVSQAQKVKEGHPKIQNRFEQTQNPKTTVTDTVPAVASHGVPAAFSPDTHNLAPAVVHPLSDALNPIPALYVGDLHPDVTESLLLEKFSSVGQVHSVRLCRARRPGTSNKYAFINFQHETDAERAFHLLNFDKLLGHPMRIMWSKRNTSFRNSNTGNIFIKGLEKSIDSLALYDIFTNFGNILSCKVVCDENGSRGYGYVHFENVEDAETAIKKLNGTLFNDFKV